METLVDLDHRVLLVQEVPRESLERVELLKKEQRDQKEKEESKENKEIVD